MTNKADKAVVDKLSADLMASQNTVKRSISDGTKSANKLDLLINEQEEIARRQNNIILKGLDLDERSIEDVAYELFEETGQNVIVKNAFAIRKEERKLDDELEAQSEEAGGNQSSGSTFESYSDKQKIMKAAPKLRDLESDIVDASNIFNTSDLTNFNAKRMQKKKKKTRKN